MSKNFFGGIPTKIDREKLTAKYGVPKEGDRIMFEDAAIELRLERDSCRFKTVFGAWRKELLAKHNVLMVATGDGAVVCADPEARIGYAVRKVRQGERSIRVGVVVAHATDAKRLTAESSAARDRVVEMNNRKLMLAQGVMR